MSVLMPQAAAAASSLTKPFWQSLPLITRAFFVFSLSIFCNKLIARAKTPSFPNFTHRHRLIKYSFSYTKNAKFQI